MRQLIVALAFVATVYLASVVPVFCVSCTTNGECTASTSCTGSSSPICQHPEGAGIVTDGGLCTCKDSTCILKEECYGNSVSLNCTDGSRHCFDGNCICDRFPIGRK